jgi:hypothetical protein
MIILNLKCPRGPGPVFTHFISLAHSFDGFICENDTLGKKGSDVNPEMKRMVLTIGYFERQTVQVLNYELLVAFATEKRCQDGRVRLL